MQIRISKIEKLWFLVALVSPFAAVIFSIVVSNNDVLWGEVGLSKWMHDKTPTPIDFLGDVLDPVITDVGAPLLFLFLLLACYHSWGRLPTIGLAMAGSMTALTRISDIVERPAPNHDFLYKTGIYHFGDGGYPSGHIVYAIMIFGMIAYLSNANSALRKRRAIQFSMLALIFLNIWTRISELHHWPGDVLGGILISTPALLLTIWIYGRLPRIMLKSPKLHRFVFPDA